MNRSQNSSWDYQQSASSMSEKTVFKDVNYVDNLDRNGIEFRDDTVEKISRNYRQSEVSDKNFEIGPNAGLVRAGLYLRNVTVNMPVRISNVICTLSFRTPSGKCLPIKTFRLRNEDYSEFDQEVYGGDDLGPYTIEVNNLNTFEVKRALRYGYIPQIHIVSYDMHRVEDSHYNPGVDNLKIVEEVVKARTATIKIIGNGKRDIHRVTAFDLNEDGTVTPGISLKKAIFLILRDRIGNGESWDIDSEGNDLTVEEDGLKWKPVFVPDEENPEDYKYTDNSDGNNWSMFSTYIKKYIVLDRDADGNVIEKEKRIEAIRSIGHLKKYNPFSEDDNPTYDPNELLVRDEFLKMKYWYILHNGRYYEGDLNDPIWAGERYEIILFDARDFNQHFETFHYTPLQSESEQDSSSDDFASDLELTPNYSDFTINTMWNRVFNEGDFDRAVYLGKMVRGDVIKLEVELNEFRSLFDVSKLGREFDQSITINNLNGNVWHKFNYTFDLGEAPVTGKPKDFSHDAWGGCNNIGLWIEESVNAHYYTVSLWKSGEGEENARVVKIEAKDVKEKAGFIAINRFSKDEQGNEIGFIEASDYRIKIRAHGLAYNVPVATLSRDGITVTTVIDPSGNNGWPEPYGISTAGSENNISVTINQAGNAEYYLIDIIGPYNYGFGNGEDENNPPPKQRIKSYAGVNNIKIANLTDQTIGNITSLTDEEKVLSAPGVYRVDVFAVNSNCLDEDGNVIESLIVPAQGDTETAFVDYHRYDEQKNLLPRRQIAEFDPKDVDMEVNFNDGSGWFRLKLSHDDLFEEDRVIDCSYTNNFVQNRERVTIYFTAPTGEDGPQNTDYNVFRGGAEEVELYLRTMAKPEYRDNVWLKPNRADFLDPDTEQQFNPESSRSLNINTAEYNDLPDYDSLKYWMNSPYTDVTYINEYDIYGDNNTFGSQRVYENLSELSGVDENDFGICSKNGMDDFFFSPMKKLSYSISASLSNVNIDYMMTETTHVDNPEYRANGGDQSIMLSNIDSQYAESFNIFWTEGKLSEAPEDLALWNFTEINVGTHGFQIGDKSTDPLAIHEDYSICIIAENGSSFSSPIYRQIRTIPQVEGFELVDPGFYNNGYGTFIDPAQPLTNNSGNILMNSGNDFAYGEPLDSSGAYDIFDTGTSGMLDWGNSKYIRIVSHGKNITDATGMGLTPIAMDLSSYHSPPGDQCYIDPARSEFIMPRPIYWSRMEDSDNLTSSEISLSSFGYNPKIWSSPQQGTSYGVDGKFGNCLTNFEFFPFNETSLPNADKGTISMWIRFEQWVVCLQSWWSTIAFNYQSGSYNRLVFQYLFDGSMTSLLYLNGSEKPRSSLPLNSWNHIYIVWDTSGGLDDGKTLRIFFNGIERMSYSEYFSSGIQSYSATVFPKFSSPVGGTFIDNLKIWNHVVSENPSWLYNSGDGREYALHPIYGEANNYRPALTGDGNGVGFYCVPEWE